MKTHKHLSLLLAAALLAGCAAGGAKRSAMLTYDTKPEGATLMLKGEVLGVAPQTRTFTLEEGKDTITTPEVVAVWPSGAKAGFWTYLKPGADDMAIIERPAKAPGLEQDLAHAEKVRAERDLAARRAKEQALREQARGSARCKEQQQSGKGAPISDC